MTNHIHPDHGAALPPGVLALVSTGGKRRPVKVVQLAAFRAARARIDVPYTVLRVPVVSLNAPTKASAGSRRAANRTMACTSAEAA